MVLFALFNMMDSRQQYKKALKSVIKERDHALYRQLGVSYGDNVNSVDYYTLIDLDKTCRALYGDEFADWVKTVKNPTDLLFKVADVTGIVLLPGTGFGVSKASARASLANLNEFQYASIGKALNHFAAEYYNEYLLEKNK